MIRRPGVIATVLVVALGTAACGGPGSEPGTTGDADPDTDDGAAAPGSTTLSTTVPATIGSPDAGCADVVDATATRSGDEWVISATVSSADTGEEKYADLWQARTPAGDVVVERVLAHPHVDEQPFTRSASPVPIPGDVTELVVAAHDSVAGWCGAVFELTLPS